MSLTRAQNIELLALLEEDRRRKEKNLIRSTFARCYDWQRNFIKNTKIYRACCLMAANRVGKTFTGCLIDAMHATGIYPDDYDGHRFDKPPLIWVLGFSGEKIRDLLQSPIVGLYSNGILTGGLIHKDLILDAIPMMGTPRAVREIKVKHISGGISRIQFWSYTQGQHALMGDSVDWYHIDEEPQNAQIYPQVLTRTATGDGGRGGRGILTFTPENGRTELVIGFMDRPSAYQIMQKVGWADAPHLTEETKESLLSMFPTWQRKMRSEGEPLYGTGLIFDLDVNACKIKPFDCPDHWLVINGMDFGWDHPQAHVQLWIDPDEGVVYVARARKESKRQPFEVWDTIKGWAKDVPTAWPHDGQQTDKGTAKQQKAYYEDAGWVMLDSHATWPEGGNGLHVGITTIYNLIKSDKFRIFDHLSDTFEEFLQYHTDEKGDVVKVKDDIISAIRYAYMMRRHAIRKCDIGQEDDYDDYDDAPKSRWA